MPMTLPNQPQTPHHQLKKKAARATTNPKLKRFRFTPTYDLHLIKSVRSVNAHLAKWGKTEALYEDVRDMFLKAVPNAVFDHIQRPSSKTLVDRFKRLVVKRRDDVKVSSVASGIVEVHGEQEQLLDDLIHEIDEKDEAASLEKEEQTEQEAKQVAAGKNIREMALARKVNGSNDSQGSIGVEEGVGQSTTSSARKSRKREKSNSDDELATSILEHSANRRELESERLALEQKRIGIDRERLEHEAKRFEMLQESTNRRLDLDEKRFAVEVEERKQSLEERKKMVDVMALLAKKLS